MGAPFGRHAALQLFHYTIFTTDKDNITYQWEITNILSQDEEHLPCKLKEDEDKKLKFAKLLVSLKN